MSFRIKSEVTAGYYKGCTVYWMHGDVTTLASRAKRFGSREEAEKVALRRTKNKWAKDHFADLNISIEEF